VNSTFGCSPYWLIGVQLLPEGGLLETGLLKTTLQTTRNNSLITTTPAATAVLSMDDSFTDAAAASYSSVNMRKVVGDDLLLEADLRYNPVIRYEVKIELY